MDQTTLLAQAELLLKQGRYADAVPMFRKVVADAPASSHAHYGLGYACFGMGEYDDAEKELQQAVKLDPGDYGALYLLGELCERQNRYSEAEHYYEAALRQNPTFAPALSKLRAGKEVPEFPAPPANVKSGKVPQQPVPDSSTAGVLQSRTNFSTFSEFLGLLEVDPAPISQKIVRLIHKTERDVRPRMLPWLMPALVRIPIVFLLAAVCFIALQALYPAAPPGQGTMLGIGQPVTAQMRQQMAEEEQANQAHLRAYRNRYAAFEKKVHLGEALVFGGLVLIFAVDLAIQVWRVSRMRFQVTDGRIVIEKGIFRQRESFELYRVTNVKVEQNFLTTLTGDAEFVVGYEMGGHSRYIEMLGLAKYAELTTLQDDLRGLVLELRSTNYGKGITY